MWIATHVNVYKEDLDEKESLLWRFRGLSVLKWVWWVWRTHKQVIKINWKLLGIIAYLCFLHSPLPSPSSSLPLSLMSLMPAFLHFIFISWGELAFSALQVHGKSRSGISVLIYPVSTANYLHSKSTTSRKKKQNWHSNGSKPTLHLIRSDQLDQFPWRAASSVDCRSTIRDMKGESWRSWYSPHPPVHKLLNRNPNVLISSKSFCCDQHTKGTYCSNICANSSMGLVSHR